MHTFEHGKVIIHHNNALRSTADVLINVRHGEGVHDYTTFAVPQQALVEFVAQLVTSERIAELEQADALTALGVRGKHT